MDRRDPPLDPRWPLGDGTPVDFGKDWRPRFIVTVDTEEEFDWDGPFTRDRHGLDHVSAMPRFQSFCEERGVNPIYLVDYPIATDGQASEMLRGWCQAGAADVGVQLHPWVNPPFEEMVSVHNSYACNLPPDLERQKFGLLYEAIATHIGVESRIYRAGRYGAGTASPDILREFGLDCDTSVRSLFDYSRQGGPNYAATPLKPYWLQQNALAELPVTTVLSGLMGPRGAGLFRASETRPNMRAALSRLGLVERIALTPEGISQTHAMRAVDDAVSQALPLLVFSFHSPSLAPGFTPYVRSEADVEALYLWWENLFAHCAAQGIAPITLTELRGALHDKPLAPGARPPLTAVPVRACSSVG